MKRIRFQIVLTLILFFLPVWIFIASPLTVVLAQDTQASPTPANSSGGIYITVLGDEPFANIRMGPSASIYPIIGKLYPGDTAPAIGRSPGGDWIQIEFQGGINNTGWVYSPLVQLSPGTLQIAEPPPTPVPPPTSTIDPTLAAQFVIEPTGTRPSTFTPAPPVNTPSFPTENSETSSDAVPPALIILSMGVFGLIGFALSLILPRR